MAAEDDALAEHLVELLGDDTSTRKMFGGVGIYRDGLMFLLIADGTGYLKVDDENRSSFTDRGLGPFAYQRKDGKSASMSYYEIPSEALDSAQAMAPWAEASVAAAVRAQKLKKPKKPKKKASTHKKKKPSAGRD